MSRVFFVAGNRCLNPYPVYPMGMAVVSAALAARGHEVRQYDLLSCDSDLARLRDAVRAFAPDVICYSLRNVDTVDVLDPDAWLLEGDRAAVAALREGSQAPVVLGGSGFSVLPEGVLDFLGGDYGVVGEGEQAACDLVEALEAGRFWPRLTRSSDLLPARQIGRPRYDSAIVPFYLKAAGLVGLQTKRGCPNACTYCTYPLLEGTRVRHRDPREVVEDIDTLRRDHGVESIFFTDSIFNDAGGGYLALAEELVRRKANVRWAAFFRPQGLDRAGLALLKRAGLYALELGTDAADDATLEAMSKSFTFEDVLRTSEACAELELPVAHYLIFGGPAETPATAAHSLANLARLPLSAVFAFVGVRILPGTRLLQRAIAEGVVAADAPLLEPTYYVSPGIARAALEASITAAFCRRPTWIFPPSEGRLRMGVMQRFGFRGIIWDQMLTRAGRRRGA